MNKKALFTHLAVLVFCLLGPPAWGAERTTYYHLDLLGSPVAASDPTGQVRWREEYKPYGERLLKPGASSGHTLWYTGKVHDDAVGLSYYGARWHDPELGRFTGIDPVDVQEGNVQSFNRYAYANNNPYKYVDPDGRAGFLAPLLVFIGKEAGSEAVEQVTGVPLPTVKNAVKTTAKIAKKAAAKKGDTDFIVSRDGAVVPNSPAATRQSLESAGFGSRKISNPSGTETGTIHSVSSMKMDVRVMDGGSAHPPRVVTTRQGTRQPVFPANGSNFGNVPKAEQRARSHIPFSE